MKIECEHLNLKEIQPEYRNLYVTSADDLFDIEIWEGGNIEISGSRSRETIYIDVQKLEEIVKVYKTFAHERKLYLENNKNATS